MSSGELRTDPHYSSTKTPSRPAVHICIVTTAHAVDDVRVNGKFVHSFRAAGWQVTWVGPAHSSHSVAFCDREGVHFLLAPPIRNRFDRMMSAVGIRQLAASVMNVDVYYTPDPDSAPIALGLAKKNGAKVIFDIHEIFHGALMDRWLFGYRLALVREYIRRRIARTCLSCDLVVGVSEAVLDTYFQDPVKRLVVRSCAPSWFADGPPAEVRGEGRAHFKVMHGKGHILRGTSKVLEAVARVAPDLPALRVIVFPGSDGDSDPYTKTLLSRAAEEPFAKILEFRKDVPIQDMPGILRTCDVGLIAYGKSLGVDSLPNRLFEYMAAGLPIIAPSYSREIARIVDAEKCGLLIDCEDPEEIAGALLYMFRNPEVCKDMGRRARNGFLARHNWEVEVRPFIERIHGLFGSRGGSDAYCRG